MPEETSLFKPCLVLRQYDKTGSQNSADATFTKKFMTEDGFVPPEDLTAAEQGDAQKAAQLDRRIRALTPEPGAWTLRDGKRLKLLEAKILNGALRLTVTQREGEKAKSV